MPATASRRSRPHRGPSSEPPRAPRHAWLPFTPNADRRAEWLAHFERCAESAHLDEAPVALNRAGDLCLREGHEPLALRYFGRAVDAYLDLTRLDAAAALCRKILRVSPWSVRPYCTLAWVAIAKGFGAVAVESIREYAEVAWRAGQESLARPHLVLMAETTADPAVLGVIGEALLDIGEPLHAEYVLGLAGEGVPLRGSLTRDELVEWACEAALMTPDELAEKVAPAAA